MNINLTMVRNPEFVLGRHVGYMAAELKAVAQIYVQLKNVV